jgi:hypothetical protein
MPARYLRECADDCEEKHARRRCRASARTRKRRFRPARAAICFTVSRVDIADRPANPIGATMRVDCSPLKGRTRAFVIRTPGKNVASEKCGRTTAWFHYAGGISFRRFVRVSAIYRIGRNGADEYSSFLI